MMFSICAKQLHRHLIRRLLMLGAIMLTLSSASAMCSRAADANPVVTKPDQAFVQAAAKGDRAALGSLLDSEFTWTDADGKTLTRSEVLQALPAPALGDQSGAEVKESTYDDVGTITASRGKMYVLRIWVKRAEGWRVLVYHEVKQLDQPAATNGTGVSVCENPCQTVPYQAQNDAERAIIASWQALETGVTAHDAAAWAPHIAEEFVQVSSNSDHPLSKAARMAILDKQKDSGVGSAPSPLVSAKMFDFRDAVVMTCLHQPFKGKAVQVSRLWIKRDGKWVMTISFQTAIQGARG
ncbi:MAG: nuclear transport factor 2 family protein [Candidatus Acidiferrum sp.]|jgi:hypothetical protein